MGRIIQDSWIFNSLIAALLAAALFTNLQMSLKLLIIVIVLLTKLRLLFSHLTMSSHDFPFQRYALPFSNDSLYKQGNYGCGFFHLGV